MFDTKYVVFSSKAVLQLSSYTNCVLKSQSNPDANYQESEQIP